MRLRIAYEGPDVTAALGGYGFWGEYTDIKRRIASFDPFDPVTDVTENFMEYTGTLDLLLEFYGVRLQAEFLRSLRKYSERPPRIRSAGPGLQPDYTITDVYGLIAYELPLKRWLGGVTITPYFMYEYAIFDDSSSIPVNYILVGGINFKPWSMVVLKLESTSVLEFESNDHWLTRLMAQLAVSF